MSTENKQPAEVNEPIEITELKPKSDNNGEGKPTGAKKVFGIVGTVFTYIIFALAVLMMIFTVISVSTFDRNNRDIFGYKAFIVRSDSMTASGINAGDLAVIKEVDPATLKEGDIISFTSQNSESFGETFTHMIREIIVNEENRPAFITYGTTTGTNDETPVTYEYVLGKYAFKLGGVGTFFMFLKTVPGYICCILLPFLLLILIQGASSIKLFREYKKEQEAELEEKRQADLAEMEAERAKLAAEREESQKLLAELKKMKEEMAQGKEDSSEN